MEEGKLRYRDVLFTLRRRDVEMKFKHTWGSQSSNISLDYRFRKETQKKREFNKYRSLNITFPDGWKVWCELGSET